MLNDVARATRISVVAKAEVEKHAVCAIEELPPGSRKAVDVDGRSICVLNVGGRLYAVRNVCPHQGGPLCLGTVSGTMMPSDPLEYIWGFDEQVLRCPWHGWEFDLETGRSLFDPEGQRVRTYPVTIEDDRVVLEVASRKVTSP